MVLTQTNCHYLSQIMHVEENICWGPFPRVWCDLPILGVKRIHVSKYELGCKVWSQSPRMSPAGYKHSQWGQSKCTSGKNSQTSRFLKNETERNQRICKGNIVAKIYLSHYESPRYPNVKCILLLSNKPTNYTNTFLPFLIFLVCVVNTDIKSKLNFTTH